MNVKKYPNILRFNSYNGFITHILIKGVLTNLSSNSVLKDNLLLFSSNNYRYIYAIDVNYVDDTLKHFITLYTLDGSHVLSLTDSSIDNVTFSRTMAN